MTVKTREFVYHVAVDCRLRHRHRRKGKIILAFSVQLEVWHPLQQEWAAVIRYDTAHGFAHRDWLHLDGTSEKIPLPIEDYKQALNYAETELKSHWQIYRGRFLEELKHEK